LAEAFHAHGPLQNYEARQALAWEYDSHRALLGPLLRQLLDEAQTIPAEAYDDARSVAHRARLALKETFRDVDVLLTYAASGAAPEGLGSTGDSRFNRVWTLMGTPCVNVPGLKTERGLPVGVQIVATFGGDSQALAAAAFVEDALRRRP